jgi:hypothetical protein
VVLWILFCHRQFEGYRVPCEIPMALMKGSFTCAHGWASQPWSLECPCKDDFSISDAILTYHTLCPKMARNHCYKGTKPRPKLGHIVSFYEVDFKFSFLCSCFIGMKNFDYIFRFVDVSYITIISGW